MANEGKGHHNNERKGYETKDGGLIRINGYGTVKIDIYDNVVDYCVEQIENGDYEKVYSRYKGSILSFKEQFANQHLKSSLVKKLKING